MGRVPFFHLYPCVLNQKTTRINKGTEQLYQEAPVPSLGMNGDDDEACVCEGKREE